MKSDEELIIEFKRGSVEAFTALVHKYQDAVLGLAYRYIGDYDEAVDIAQETFVRLYRHADTVMPTMRLTKYLFTIAANVARSELKRYWRREAISLDGEEFEHDEEFWEQFVATDYRPDSRLDRTELSQRIQWALMQLPPLLREAVILRDIKECNYEDIAEITNAGLGTVRSRINRARKILRGLLADVYQDRLK